MRVAGDIELRSPSEGTTGLETSSGSATTYPFIFEGDGLSLRASSSLHPSCARARLEATGMAMREVGSGELECGGSISIAALDAAQSPGHPQLLCNCWASKHRRRSL